VNAHDELWRLIDDRLPLLVSALAMFLPLDLMSDDNKRIVLMLRYCEARLSYLHRTVGVVFRRRKIVGSLHPHRGVLIDFTDGGNASLNQILDGRRIVSFTQFAAEPSDFSSLGASLQYGFFFTTDDINLTRFRLADPISCFWWEMKRGKCHAS
jgi:hypothetical protein